MIKVFVNLSKSRKDRDRLGRCRSGTCRSGQCRSGRKAEISSASGQVNGRWNANPLLWASCRVFCSLHSRNSLAETYGRFVTEKDPYLSWLPHSPYRHRSVLIRLSHGRLRDVPGDATLADFSSADHHLDRCSEMLLMTHAVMVGSMNYVCGQDDVGRRLSNRVLCVPWPVWCLSHGQYGVCPMASMVYVPWPVWCVSHGPYGMCPMASMVCLP